MKRSLLVSIDTEPDDQWSVPPPRTTHNVTRLPRLQELFDTYGVRPTYFVEYLVASDPVAVRILRDFFEAGKCEIAAHLHGWTTPPDYDVPPWPKPYLYQYPKEVQRAKLQRLHEKLASEFKTPPISYRAGRFGFDEHGLQLLAELGYVADSSVTPGIQWEQDAGNAPDFRRAPFMPYEICERDVCSPGASGVIEVPVSIGYTLRWPRSLAHLVLNSRPRLPGRIMAKACGLRRTWFRPFLHNKMPDVRAAARWLLQCQKTGFINMMFHSSELLPNSKWTRNENEIKLLLERIEQLIILAIELGCEPGLTIGEFARLHRDRGVQES